MSNQYYFFGTRTTFIQAAPKIFRRVNGALNFTLNDLCGTLDKNTNFDISKNLRCKVGISNSLCSRAV